MRRLAAAALVSLAACRTSAPATLVRKPPRQVASPAAPPGPLLVLGEGGGVYVAPAEQTTPAGKLVFVNDLGVFCIDPATHEERLVFRLPDRAQSTEWHVAGSTGVMLWNEASSAVRWPGSSHLQTIDLESGVGRDLVMSSPGSFLLGEGGLETLWVPNDGAEAGVLYDAKTGRVLQRYARRDDGNGLAALGERHVQLGGTVFEKRSGREVWREPGGVGDSSFVRVGDRELVVWAEDRTLTLVDLETGVRHEANVDCLHGSHRWRDETSGGVFLRLCAQGVLYMDLRKLAQHEGKKPMAPVRVRRSSDFRMSPAGRVELLVRARANAEGEWRTYDHEGHPSIEPSASTNADAREPPAAPPGWGPWPGTRLTSFEVHEGMLIVETRLVGPEEEHGSGFAVPRTLADPTADFEAVDDPKLAMIPEPDREAVRRILPVDLGAGCTQLGFVAHHTLRLFECVDRASRSYVRLDARTLQLRSVRAGGGLDSAASPGERKHLSAPLPSDGLSFRRRSGGAADELQILAAATGEPLLNVKVSEDFALITDHAGHVQIAGNRRNAQVWLRCLQPDGRLTPFDACAKTAEQVLY